MSIPVGTDWRPGQIRSPPPEIRITRPSKPPEPSPPALAESLLQVPARPRDQLASAAANLREDGFRVKRSAARFEKGKEREPGERPSEGRQQTQRRVMTGPGGIIARIASQRSLSEMTLSQPIDANPSAATLNPVSAGSTLFLRPAPDRPSSIPGSSPRLAPSSSQSPSPSPSRQRSPVLVGASSRSGSVAGAPSGQELVEIPRFKKRELLLAIVGGHSLGPKIAWIGLWVAWLSNGLLSLFFDVNVMYMTVQCAMHPTSGMKNGRGWDFATAAYAICCGISTLCVWLGWELGYEFWRRWRLPRPSIEPIHFSLPSTLHLSLLSFPHFTFLLHIRLSPLNTPYAEDVIPETCFALVQLAPGLLLLLPRAAIAIVLLTAFSSSGSGPADETIGRDPSFFSLNDQLTPYAKGVLLAFITWVAVRFLLVLLSAIELWVSSCHPLGGLIGSGIRLSRRQSSETPFTPRPPPVSRDPAQTRSPQISWLSEENAFHWDWKDRSRARIQDAFELCTIRRPGVLGDSAFWKESRHVSEQNDTVGPPSLASPRTLTTQSEVSSDDFLKQVVAEMPSRPATRHGDDPPRPESLLEPMSSRNMDPPVHDAPYHHVGASTSSHDLFYTPTGGNTPSDEKARSFVESQGISAHLGIRGFSDPSEFGVLVINPNRDSSTFSEVLTIDDSAEPVCLKHHRVHHQTGSESA